MTFFADPSLPLVAAEAALELRRLRLGICGICDLRAVISLGRGLEHGMPQWVYQEAEALGFLSTSGESEGDHPALTLANVLDPDRIARVTPILNNINERQNQDDLKEAEAFCWELSDCARQLASVQACERLGMDVSAYGGARSH